MGGGGGGRDSIFLVWWFVHFGVIQRNVSLYFMLLRGDKTKCVSNQPEYILCHGPGRAESGVSSV